MCIFFIPDYIEDLLQRVYRRRDTYKTIALAQQDFRIGFDQPDPLTNSFQDFDKNTLIQERRSRFN